MNPLRLAASRTSLLSLAAALVAAPSLAAQAAPPASAPRVDRMVSSADQGRILGKATAPIWVLIVSDFQCPYCRQWHQETWHAFKKEFVDPGKVRVAFVNFPLGIHPNAKPAARYAMCASTQGKFWEFADEIFNTQDKWKGLPNPSGFFDGIAIKLKLPGDLIGSCVLNRGITSLVDADYTRMSNAGAASTPTFFVGKTVIEGAQPIAAFRRVIAAELAAVKK
jgi:protein-disulfide isomerase